MSNDVAGFDAPAAMDVVAERHQAPPLETAAEHYYYQHHQAPAIDFTQPPLFYRATGSPSSALCANINGKDEELAALFSGMDLAGNNAALMEVEPADDVRPVEEAPICFVPFVRGQLDCTNRRSVPEILHESGKITNTLSHGRMAHLLLGSRCVYLLHKVITYWHFSALMHVLVTNDQWSNARGSPECLWRIQ